MDTLKAIEKRFSVREFSEKKVKWSDIIEAIDAAGKAPFAGNINHLKFVIVEDQKNKNEIAKYSDQPWIADSKFIIVMTSNNHHLVSLYDDRAESYSKQQSGAAIQNILLRLTSLKIGSCWVGIYNEDRIKQLLSIPEKMTIEALIPVGYPKGKTIRKRKAAVENLMYWEKWGKNNRSNFDREPETK